MIKHPFPPLYDKDSKILVLGSFPSVKSREQLFFYGHPQNRFWNDLDAIIKNSKVKRIFVNGKTAEKYYNKYTKDKLGRAAVCLPSTSPANAAWSIERLVGAWRIINE